jgi:hypothetical protein
LKGYVGDKAEIESSGVFISVMQRKKNYKWCQFWKRDRNIIT